MKSKKALSFLTAFTMAVTTFLGSGAVTMADINAANAYPAPTKYEYRNVMYYGDWSVYGGQKNFNPAKLDASQVTHLNFAFMDFDKNGELVLCDEWADFQIPLPETREIKSCEPYGGVLGAMSMLRSKNPNLKIGISVGGWTRCGDFPVVCADPVKRKNLVNNLVQFIDYLSYDFIDIDWEYPTDYRLPDPRGNGVKIDEGCMGGPEDGHNFTLLMKDLRNGLDELGKKNGKYYELSCAMSANPRMMDVIEYDQVMKYADFVNMMTYDLNGAWNDYTAHQTPLYTNPNYDKETIDANGNVWQASGEFSIDSTIKFLKNKYNNQLDMSKVVVGVAAYTRGVCKVQGDTSRDPNAPGLYAKAERNSILNRVDGETTLTDGSFSYNALSEIKGKYGVKEYWDDTAKAPYLYGPDTGYFFTYDNPRSVAEKGKYVKQNGLGGLICWMASQDNNNELTRAMKTSLYGSKPLKQHDVQIARAKGEVDIKTTESTFDITLKNAEKAVETNVAMKDAEAFKKTIFNPTLYIKTANDLKLGSLYGATAKMEGDYCVITFPGMYDAAALHPGKTLTFSLSSNMKPADINNIISVEMSQNICSAMGESERDVIYFNPEAGKPIPTKLDAPVMEGKGGNNEVILSWNAIEGASYYDIYMESNGQFTKYATSKTTDCVIKPLVNTVPYTFVVRAVNAKCESKNSNAVTVTPGKEAEKPVAPDTPVNVTAVAGDKSATISWGKVDKATSYDVYQYNGTEYVKVGTTKNTTYTAKNLDNGKMYKFAVKAVNEAGESGFSVTATVTPVAKLTAPAAPKVVAAGGKNIVNLNWNNVENADSYEVYQMNNGKYELIATVTTTDYTAKNLEDGTEYKFAVKALNKAGASKFGTAAATTEKAEEVKPDPKPDPEPTPRPETGKLPAHMVTGYWHNFCNGSANLKLRDVPEYYDMVCIAFTGNTMKNGEATFSVDPDLAKAVGGYTDEEFINDVKTLQSRGQHVIISVGGAEGRITIASEKDAKVFADSMKKIIRDYGFEGIDIDLEGGAVAGTQYIASALRDLHNTFGEDFIITMAPETFYIMTPQSSYAKLAMEIKDILTICYPQFYNTGSMNGYQGTVVYPRTADMMTSMSTTLIEDCGLRPDQIGFGVPAMNQAGGGCYTIAEIEKAVNAFVNGTSSGNFTAPQAYPGFRSMMTWSINWDATQNYSWAKAMDKLMDSLGDVKPVEPTAPKAPVVNVTAGDKTATITWNNVKGADKYEVYMMVNGQMVKKAAVNATSYTFNNLENGKEYTFGVKAVNKAGASTMTTVKATPVAKVVAPKAPTGVKATANKNTVTITWNKVKNADSYEVYQQTQWGGYDKVATVNGTSAVIENLADGNYTFVVKAVNTAGASAYSASATVTIKTEEVKPNPDPDPNPNPDPDPDPNPNPNPNPDPNPDVDPEGFETYVPGKTYLKGDKVIFNGQKYTCKWWSNKTPETERDAWQKVREAGDTAWDANEAYTGGATVTYNGKTYKAKWWTQNNKPDAPGAPWELVA